MTIILPTQVVRTNCKGDITSFTRIESVHTHYTCLTRLINIEM